MDIKEVTKLYESGTLTEMYKAGFVSTKVFTYMEIYLWVDSKMKISGISKTQAVLEAEIKFKKDEMTIWRALGSFQ